jgi:hypothetical protein
MTDQDTVEGEPMHALMRETQFKQHFDFLGPESEDTLTYVVRNDNPPSPELAKDAPSSE